MSRVSVERRFRTAVAAIRRAVVRVVAGAATAAIVVGYIGVRCAASVVSAFVRDFDGGGWPTHRGKSEWSNSKPG